MEYQGFIFTKHAQERAQLRSLTLDQIIRVLENPDTTIPFAHSSKSKFIKMVHDRQVHVVANYLGSQKKWLIISVWVRGEDDPVPFTWLVLTAPFKLILWIAKLIWKQLKKSKTQDYSKK